jgi:hypothetical protein
MGSLRPAKVATTEGGPYLTAFLRGDVGKMLLHPYQLTYRNKLSGNASPIIL